MASFLKPGSALVIIIGAFMVLGMYSWVSGNFDTVKNSSIEQQQTAVDCTTVQIDFVDRNTEGNSTQVFLQSNQDLEAVLVVFHGTGTNSTQVINEVSRNSIVTASANIAPVNRVEARAKSCNRRFADS